MSFATAVLMMIESASATVPPAISSAWYRADRAPRTNPSSPRNTSFGENPTATAPPTLEARNFVPQFMRDQTLRGFLEPHRAREECVGVVAIGRNEGDRLIRCFDSVAACTRHIVYVDSGSTDGSIDVAISAGAHVVKLDLTRPFTAARARNEGFLVLKSLKPDLRFVQFIDGDCALAPEWLEHALAFIRQRNDVAVVCGRRRERRPEASIYNYFCDLEWNTPIGEALACGGDSLMRVEAFEAVRGFHPALIAGEEPELCLRLRERGWKIWRLDAEMTEHDAAMARFGQWWVRAVRGGYAFAEVAWLHRNSRFGIWRRETLRAVFWGAFLPTTIVLGALLCPAALLGAAAYFLQICRIALRDRSMSQRVWLHALLLTISKFAECQGVMKVFWRKQRRSAATLIEYK